jgi:hypothetical protein
MILNLFGSIFDNFAVGFCKGVALSDYLDCLLDGIVLEMREV